LIRHSMAEIYLRFGTVCSLNSSTLKTETECPHETSANFHKAIWCRISHDYNPVWEPVTSQVICANVVPTCYARQHRTINSQATPHH